MSNLLENNKQKTLEQSVNKNIEKSEEVALRKLSPADIPIMQNNAEVNQNEHVEINIPSAQYKDLDMSSFEKKAVQNINSKLHKIDYKISSTSIEDNPYGNFKIRLDKKSREKAIKNKRSRLYRKNKNASLIEEAKQSVETSRALLTQNVNDLFTADEKKIMWGNPNYLHYITLIGNDNPQIVTDTLKENLTDEKKESIFIENIIDSFLETPINMDLSSDTIIAENAINYENQGERYRAYKALLLRINEENTSIPSDKLEAFNQKLEDMGKLVGYYEAKYNLITDNYYKNHYDDELGLYYGKHDKEDLEDHQRNRVSSLILEEQAWKHVINGENVVFLEELNKIKETEEKKAYMLATNMIAYQTNTKHAKHDKKLLHKKIWESKGLKFISAFMRNSYTALHGKNNYNESLKKLDYIPKELQRLNDENSEHLLYKHFNNSPEIDITKLYKDNYKAELKTMYKKILKLSIKDKNPKEHKRLLQAMNAYLKTNGIVNKDTVEMEMAFLDQFLASSNAWIKSNESVSNTEDYKNIVALRNKILTYSKGGLKDNMSDADFEFVTKNAITVREYIGQHKGGVTSNIKDIPLFLHQPTMNDIKQSTIGDCWFLSSVTSIVKISPDFIRNMFYDLGDGRVMVRLYDAKSKHGYRQHNPRLKAHSSKEDIAEWESVFTPVYVILDKQYETGLGNAADCPWLQLLERAYAACGFNHSVTSFEKTKDGKLNMHHMIDEMTNGAIDLGISHMIGNTALKEKLVRDSEPHKRKRAKRLRDMEDNTSESFKKKNKELKSVFSLVTGTTEDELDSNVEYKNYSGDALRVFQKVKKTIDVGGVVPCQLGGHCMDILDAKAHNGRLMVLIRDPFNIFHQKYTNNIYEKPDSAGLGSVLLKHLGYRKLSKDEKPSKTIHKGFLGTSWWDMDEVMKEIGIIVPLTKDMIKNQ